MDRAKVLAASIYPWDDSCDLSICSGATWCRINRKLQLSHVGSLLSARKGNSISKANKRESLEEFISRDFRACMKQEGMQRKKERKEKETITNMHRKQRHKPVKR